MARDNEDLNGDGHLEVNETPAQYVFAGIRKIIEVEANPSAGKGVILSGTEVTYSIMEVDTISEVEMLASGKMTNILYRE